ncbi:MAG TPA: EAL domain-containing protein [Pseudonocardia sp.]
MTRGPHGGHEGPEGVARAWADAIAGTSFVPLKPGELVACLLGHTRRLAAILHGSEFDPAQARDVGVDLVSAHFTGAETLGRTLDVLGECLPLLVDARVTPDATRRLCRTLGALAAGYAAALREATIIEQEEIGRAVLLARCEAEAKLLASEKRFRAMFTEAAIGIGIGDLDGRILEVNPALTRMFGHSAGQFTGLNVSDMVHPDDAPDVWRLYEDLVLGRRDDFRTEKRFFRADGSIIWTHLTVSLVRDEDGAPHYQVAMLEDVTERVRLQSSVEHLAYHDPLTGLPNRALFTQRLEAAFETPIQFGRIGLCLLDLDGFKRINDSLGHHVGDALLVAIAERLASCCTAQQFVARMSGDEFIFLASPSTLRQLRELAERVLAALSTPISLGAHELRVSASLGLVDREVAQTTPADLMSAADITLYRAKRDGKGHYVAFDREYTDRERARITMSATMPRAIDDGEFFLEYQPLVPLCGAAAMSGVEALLRWRHPTLGLLGPDQFVGLTEETGAIVPLGRWVLATACAQARSWRAEFGDRAPLLSVNLAPRQLEEPDLVGEVAAILADTGLDPAHLQLELTEQAVMRDEPGPIDALRALDRMGVRLVIDDFGTGYSNLSYLSRLPVHGLKLDASFLTQIRTPENTAHDDELIMSTLVSLAHGLGLTVTAEGIETRAQLVRVRSVGCDVGQGWYFARPGTPESISSELRASSSTTRDALPAEPGAAG